MTKGVAFPGLIYVDSEGNIVETFFEDSYRVRPTPGSVLAKLFPEARSEPSLERGQDYLLEQTGEGGILGSQWEISVTFPLPEGSHLYAPGSESYVPLSLELEPHPLFYFEPAVFPPAKAEYLPSIDEELSVYSGVVRVSIPVTLAPHESLKKLEEPMETTIKGVLKYQICTDTSCLLPVETEVEWKTVVKPLDRERASEGVRH
jgi:cytochrome c biogenesis DsbD-like protein